jgi:D-3-phosphoglycerate dehydrogenase
MSKPWTVLLPEPIEAEARQLLEDSGARVILSPDKSPATVAPLMAEADAVVLRTGIKMSADLVALGTTLKTISRTGAGFDNVDVKAATEHGVIVSSSLGANTTTVAEHALALIFSLYKQLPTLDREMRKGNFKVRYDYLSRDLRGKTLGVIGIGRIGTEIAKACHDSFGMKVVAFDEYLPDAVKAKLSSWVDFVALDGLCAVSDVITMHVPLTDGTRGLINAQRLSLMKKDAIIVNTSRGGVIDEKALAEALNAGNLGGAGLDVFEDEPPKADNPLLACDKAILTPHAAALTQECVVRMAVLGAQRVIDMMNGFVPDNIANPEVLKQERWKGLSKKL